MKRKWLTLALLMCAPGILPDHAHAAESPKCPVFPLPKEYRETGETLTLAGPGLAMIAVGEEAGEVERYAAEQFQAQVERLSGRRLPIGPDSEISPDVRQVFLLGVRRPYSLVDRLCAANTIDLSEESPGFDGYVVEVLKHGAQQVILVGAGNDRGVLYGQYTLYDLMRRDSENGVAFPAVSIRDWPTIKWRSWWEDRPGLYLRPGILDAWSRARINQSQLSSAPSFPGEADELQIRRTAVEQFHRRGIFVYGMLHCAVDAEDHEEVMARCQEHIDVGCDGLYMRFDDAGPGSDPVGLVTAIYNFAAERDILGEKLALLPPIGSYENPESSFNQAMAKLPGLRDIQWFFTTEPKPELGEMAEKLGLSIKPAWWHNWPMEDIGFPVDPKGADWRSDYYRVLLPLKHGWGSPTFDSLRDADKYINVASVPVRPKPEYLTALLGHWAWDPKRFEWEDFRIATYAYVFGPDQAEAAREYDDAMIELRNLFRFRWRNWYEHGWALIDRADSAKALEQVDRMDKALETIEAGALKDTSIDLERLRHGYLTPMRQAVHFARIQSTVEFPEYAVAPKVADRQETAEGILAEKMRSLLLDGKEQEAKEYLTDIAARMEPLFEPFSDALGDLKFTSQYIDNWREQLDFDYWTEQVKNQVDRIEITVRRDMDGVVTMETNAQDAQLTYTFDGSDPGGSSEQYSGPFPFERQGVIKAAVRFPGSGIMSAVHERHFGILQKNWQIARVDSEEGPDEAASKAIDGDPNTNWITEWKLRNAPLPHEIAIDLGESVDVAAFGYLPRKGNVNGTIVDWEFYVSDDPEEWGEPVQTGSFSYDEGRGFRRGELAEPARGRYVKLKGLSEIRGNQWTSAGEIDIFAAR